jgi:hypothetical protein
VYEKPFYRAFPSIVLISILLFFSVSITFVSPGMSIGYLRETVWTYSRSYLTEDSMTDHLKNMPPCFANSEIQADTAFATVFDEHGMTVDCDEQIDPVVCSLSSAPPQCLNSKKDEFLDKREPCPVGGRCNGGLLLDCASNSLNMFEMSPLRDTCFLTNEGARYVDAVMDALIRWNVKKRFDFTSESIDDKVVFDEKEAEEIIALLSRLNVTAHSHTVQ